MGEARPFGRLVAALDAEGIRFVVIGMAAAIAQGVMGSTLDIDLWVELPPRQYMRVQNIARQLGASVAANTVVYLEDGIPVNFVFEVTGLGRFANEWRHSHVANLHGQAVRVLDLARIRASKDAIRRDKDLLHIRLIDDFLSCRREVARQARATGSSASSPRRRQAAKRRTRRGSKAGTNPG